MTDPLEPIGTWGYFSDLRHAPVPCTCPPLSNGVIPPECRIHNPAGQTYTTTGTGGVWRIDPDPLTVPEPYATVDEGNPGAVIVWMLGAIIAALIVAVAWLAWTR